METVYSIITISGLDQAQYDMTHLRSRYPYIKAFRQIPYAKIIRLTTLYFKPNIRPVESSYIAKNSPYDLDRPFVAMFAVYS